ncbi:MAG TPA: hypothetical protein VFZ42_01845 [Chitinophagaceae bacterium]
MKTVVVLLMIAFFLALAYASSRLLLLKLRPRESFRQLMLYIAACLLLIFLLSFLMVFVITRLFPTELMR